jgi:hypothetical protein
MLSIPPIRTGMMDSTESLVKSLNVSENQTLASENEGAPQGTWRLIKTASSVQYSGTVRPILAFLIRYTILATL